MDEYTAWANVPGNLKTKTGLREMNLKPAPGQEPAAIFRNKFNHKRYKLYLWTPDAGIVELVNQRIATDA